ncbi:MFS transporter [Mesorhizobium sp. C120A]|uniref:MFS transporter n=1 Tax=unclassified Mesorhizobium TaxID=325217 RepID=UPI000422D739|nr:MULTISPECIES: MFS transporter [unclassified Mesorhizobium]WJI46059.1 MFS transporter [Mesorhizobium sp. C120A]
MKNRSSLLRRLAIAVSAIGFGQSAFVSLVPLVMERLRVDTFAIGAATAVGAAAFLVGSPLWGRMGERLGHARLLRLLGLAILAGQAVFAILLIAGTGAALGIALLMLSRTVYGFAASGVMPTAQVWASRSVADDRRQAALGLLGAGVSMGRLAGALAATAAVLSPLLPPILFLFSPLLLWLARGKGEAGGRTDGRAADVGRGISPFDRRALPCLAMGLCLTLGFGQAQMMLGPMVQQRFGLGATQATTLTGLALMLVAVVMVLVQGLLMARLRLAERNSVIVGCLMVCVGMTALAVTASHVASAASLVVAAAGISLATPGYTAWLMKRLEPGEQGAAAGWLTSTHVLGQSIGALAGGFAFTLWPFAPLAGCAALALAAACLAAMVRETGR